MKKRPVVERFWEKVEKTETCWLWTRNPTKRYGTISTEEFPKGEKAHRVSWKLHFGPIPDGMNVLHKCDITKCVRPDHLFLGTQDENNKDKAQKGRSFRPEGVLNGRTTMTVDQVKLIKGDIGTLTSLSGKYGVSVATISRIRRGESWKSLE